MTRLIGFGSTSAGNRRKINQSNCVNRKADIAHGRILVRGVNWLGDAVMTTPALLRLREACADAHITVLAPEKLKGLWQHHPAVNDVLTFAAKETIFSVASRLRERKFTDALVLPNSPRSALEVFLAGIPRRIGYARGWRGRLLTEAIPSRAEAVKMHKRTTAEIKQLIAVLTPPPRETLPPAAHHIYDYLHLVASIGGDPRPLAPLLRAIPFAETGLARLFTAGSKRAACLIGLNPGAEYGPAKRWPVENFAAAANELYRRLDCEFLILGGAGDVALAEQLRA